MKADFSRVSLGLALFEIKRDASYLNLNNDFVRNGRFRHRGVEFNTSARIAWSLTLTANLARLGTQLQDVTDADILGKRSEGVPRGRACSARATGWRACRDYRSIILGSRPVDAQNSGFIPGYTVWDAGVSYDTVLGNTPTTFRLYGKNLTDKDYYPAYFLTAGRKSGAGARWR